MQRYSTIDICDTLNGQNKHIYQLPIAYKRLYTEFERIDIWKNDVVEYIYGYVGGGGGSRKAS